MPDSKDKKPKWGGLFHKDRPDSTADSTYSSEGSRNSYNNGNTPSMTESNASQNSGNNNEVPTKQVVNDQGQVVTTTTTTTTTTTSGGGNANVNSSSSDATPHNSSLANKLDPRVNTSESDQSSTPSIPPKSNMRRDPSPNPTPQQIRQSNASRGLQGQSSQQQGYDRYPGGYGDTSSQGGHNFSYPGRVGSGGNPATGQQPSTLQNIKAAAVGVHGAGETLRGTFNSSIDRRFNAPPEQVAGHNQVASSGRTEMDSGQLSNDSRQAGGIGTGGLKGILRKSQEGGRGPGAGGYDGR